jgi:hypothetical protein
MKKLLLLILLVPSLAFAATEDEPMPKRASAQPMLCVNNEDLDDRSTTQGDAQYLACDDKGRPIMAGSVSVAQPYTEGATDATIDGTPVLWEDAANTLATVSASKPLPVVQTGALAAGTNNIGDVDVLSIVPGTGATNAGKAEDAAHTTGDTGVCLAVRQDALASSVDTDADYGFLKFDALGAVWVRERHAATGTVTSVNDAATSATCLAANVARNLATLFNDSTVNAYVKFGTTASATDFTTVIPAQGLYEVPKQYSGRIDCIWASDASGAMRVTEVTY